MDPNLNYNFGYGENYATAAGTDHTSDPVNHYGWANQWQPPAPAQPAANAYPQYVSQQQHQHQQAQVQHIQAQQQRQQQHSHQQAQQVPNPYANLGSIGTFMQQTPSKPAQQFQQKKVAAPKTPVNRMPYGGHAPNPMSVIGGNEWAQPSPPGSFGARQFGQSSRNPFFGQQQKSNWKNKGKAPTPQKKFDTVGKTPAMVLHELYKSIGEDYIELETVPKKYRCTITVNGRQFQMDSPNKKAAKQKCAELVIKELRPDLHLTPFEEGITAKAVPVLASGDGPAASGNGQSGKRNIVQADAMDCQKKTAPIKKAKLTPVESALSLLDLMQKIIAESSEKYTPVFDISDVIKTEPVAESEHVLEKEVTENEKKGASKKNDSQVTVSLKFAEQGKVYSKTGTARGILKDTVIREALRDLFGVSNEDITTVARRHASNRLGSDMTILQCLNTICSILNCTVTQEVEPAEDRPIGEGRMFFMGKCTIIDHNENDKQFQTSSPSFPSKGLAREYAAREMLRNYFKIDPNICERDGNVPSQGPCAVLHAMMNKQTRQKTKIVYEFKDNVPAVAGQPATVFYCECVIDEKDRYTGSGRSKKLAKSEAAMVALKKIFHIDFDPAATYPLALSTRTINEAKVTPLCRTIAEFCKREYHHMAQYYQIQPSNQIACFLLVNENLEKRLLSIGSALQCVVEPDTLNGAQGTALIHMDPIVLARRALVRAFIDEIEVLQTSPESSVFEKQPDGKAQLKPNLKLILYSNYAPVCTFSVPDANEKRLSYLTPTSVNAVPNDLMTMEQIKATKTFRIHTTADKVFKWNNLGVQGALLSNFLHPIVISHIFFGSESPIPDDYMRFSMRDRLGEDHTHQDFTIESVPVQMRLQTSYPHLWVRGSEGLETLDYNSGRTSKGSPSKICKAEIFRAYRRLKDIDPSLFEYAKAKEASSEYQYEKKVFYGKLEAAGFGKWQIKPPSFVDQFTLSSLD